MNDYVIGSGAVLTAGPNASIAGATLHAQTDAAIAATVRAAVVDFESRSANELTKVVMLATGWSPARVKAELVAPLRSRRVCTLRRRHRPLGCGRTDGRGPSLRPLAPRRRVDRGALRREGVTLVVHPIETIRQAALICGQQYVRWPLPLRAA